MASQFNMIRARPRHQRGLSLVMTLIAMVAILLIGIAMVRVVDFSGLMTRNLAFREGGIHTAEVGVQYGMAALGNKNQTELGVTTTASCSANSVTFSNCYYPVDKDTNDDGVPDNITWTGVTAISSTITNGYTVRFIIERLCDPDILTDPQGGSNEQTYCQFDITSSGTAKGGSKKIGSAVFSSSAKPKYYRITSRSEAPGGGLSISQVIVSR